MKPLGKVMYRDAALPTALDIEVIAHELRLADVRDLEFRIKSAMDGYFGEDNWGPSMAGRYCALHYYQQSDRVDIVIDGEVCDTYFSKALPIVR